MWRGCGESLDRNLVNRASQAFSACVLSSGLTGVERT